MISRRINKVYPNNVIDNRIQEGIYLYEKAKELNCTGTIGSGFDNTNIQDRNKKVSKNRNRNRNKNGSKRQKLNLIN